QFPPAALMSKNGKPLLSWRVALLPFLEEDQLYKRFKLDEPWDGPNNKKLLSEMPRSFSPVQDEAAKRGETYYQAFVGPGALFESGRKIRMADITDGTSNTVLVAEAAAAVPWTKPEDLPFDANKPLPKLGGFAKDSLNVAFADGAVHLIKKDFDEKTMKMA